MKEENNMLQQVMTKPGDYFQRGTSSGGKR